MNERIITEGGRVVGFGAAVLFLDVDGVLNCSATWKGPHADNTDTLDPVMCDRLASIVRATGCTVVLSSTWRLYDDDGLKKLYRWLEERGAPIHSRTPDCGMCRGDEIKAWLDAHAEEFPDPRIVILDDDSDFLDEQRPFHVQTDFLGEGLTDAHAFLAIDMLHAERAAAREGENDGTR